MLHAESSQHNHMGLTWNSGPDMSLDIPVWMSNNSIQNRMGADTMQMLVDKLRAWYSALFLYRALAWTGMLACGGFAGLAGNLPSSSGCSVPSSRAACSEMGCSLLAITLAVNTLQLCWHQQLLLLQWAAAPYTAGPCGLLPQAQFNILDTALCQKPDIIGTAEPATQG
jgi:hypothetical protein